MRKAITPAIHPRVPYRTVLPGLLFSLLVHTGEAKGQCISTGAVPATLLTAENNSKGLPFSAVGNAAHADNHYAFAQPLEALQGEERTQYLKASGFNLSIPANAVICGVTVHILKRASGVSSSTTVNDDDLRLLKGGSLAGQNKSSSATWASDLVMESYSGDATFWGTALTPSDLNDPRFGIALSARMASSVAAYPRVEIDQVTIEVAYQTNTAAPQNVQEFTAALEKNIVSCEWIMVEEEAGSRIILQQSADNRQWKDVATYSITSTARQARYRQVSRLEEMDTYYYRIKVVSKDGTTSYSKTARVQYNTSGEVKVYPTVAHSMIYVENADASDKIQVYNFSNQAMPITTVRVKDGLTAVRISELPKGRYLLKTGRTAKQFIKE